MCQHVRLGAAVGETYRIANEWWVPVGVGRELTEGLYQSTRKYGD